MDKRLKHNMIIDGQLYKVNTVIDDSIVPIKFRTKEYLTNPENDLFAGLTEEIESDEEELEAEEPAVKKRLVRR